MYEERTEDKRPVRAAQYVRMSTEHQQYSTENQADVIKEYADARGYVIVKTYKDKGKSGLRVEGRDALKRLLEDVQSGHIDYEAILVYDVSRWGRFQDSDESAYYEYICKRAGIQIEYCAEQFENDGRMGPLFSPTANRTVSRAWICWRRVVCGPNLARMRWAAEMKFTPSRALDASRLRLGLTFGPIRRPTASSKTP